MAPQPELLRLLADLGDIATRVVECADARAWVLSPEQRARAIEQLAQVRRVADAGHLALVRSLSEGEAGTLGATSVAALLSWRLRVPHGRARADVEAARATDPDGGELPALGAALAAGEVGTGHVDVAVRVLDRLPTLLRREHAGAIDAFLSEQSRTFRPGECEHLAGRVLDRIDPSRAERGFDPDAFARRHLTITPDSTGMVLVRGQLDPVAGAQLTAAVAHFAAPTAAVEADAAQGQGSIRVVDDRTPGQRRADALGVLARQGASQAGSRGGEPPRIIVHATVDQLLDRPGAGRAVCEQTGGPISAAVLRRLRADAALQAVLMAPSGAVLRLGRSVRCVSAAQRRALLARDGGCVIPGCGAPSAQLEGHHVTSWAAGGLTDVDGLVLACGPHHTAIEVGTWAVRMVEGVPQLRAPRWVDPDQRWLLLPRRVAERSADRLGRQLVLGAVTGPAVTGPAVTGPAVTGPAVTGPAVTDPAVTGPAVTGPAFTPDAVARARAPGERAQRPPPDD